MDYTSLTFLISTVVLGFALYYLFLRDKIYGPSIENFEHPGRAPLEVAPMPYSGPKTVMSSGPSAPAQEAPRGEVVMHAGPAPRDPLAEDEEESNAAPKMTYPERSFRPAPQNDQVGLAQESGIAGPPNQHTPQNVQQFGLDMIQNQGEFYNGIYANDTTSDTNFSAF
jgi:hypothetical protein